LPNLRRVVEGVISEFKPKHRVHLGDLWDFRPLRRGACREEMMDGFRNDYRAGLDLLDWYKPHLLTLGNHDHRIWRAATETSDMAKAELFESFCDDVEDNLRKRKIKWSEWGVRKYLQLPFGGPKLLHGYATGLNVARKNHQLYGDSIAAHNHTPDQYEARHIDGGQAFSVGTSADIDKMKYADGQPAKLGWRNSILCTIHNTKTGAWEGFPVVRHGKEWVSSFGIFK